MEAVEMAIQLGFSTAHGTAALNAVQGKRAYTDTTGSGASSPPRLQTTYSPHLREGSSPLWSLFSVLQIAAESNL